MARMRFFSEDGQFYVSLNVEVDGLYHSDTKPHIRHRRKSMPPKRETQVVSKLTNDDTLMAYGADNTLFGVKAVLDDIALCVRSDPKAYMTLKPGLKGKGWQFSLFYLNQWDNFYGDTPLAAVLAYYQENLEEAEQPPPTPLKKGGRDSA